MSSPFLPESPLGAPDRAEEFAPRQQELPPGDSLRPAAGQLRPPVGHEPSGQVPAFSREQRIKAAEMGLVNKRAQMRGTVVGLTGGAIGKSRRSRWAGSVLTMPFAITQCH